MSIDEINENEESFQPTEDLPYSTEPISTSEPIEENTPNPWQQNILDLTKVREGVEKIKTEIQKVIIGQEEMMDLLLAALFTGGHVLVEGVPGIAKTLTAKLMARTLDVGFSRIQFTPDLMPSDVVGTTVYNMKSAEFTFNEGPVFSNVILIDEINRAPAKTQSALF